MDADIRRALERAPAADRIEAGVEIEQVRPTHQVPVDQPFGLIQGELPAIGAQGFGGVAAAAMHGGSAAGTFRRAAMRPDERRFSPWKDPAPDHVLPRPVKLAQYPKRVAFGRVPRQRDSVLEAPSAQRAVEHPLQAIVHGAGVDLPKFSGAWATVQPERGQPAADIVIPAGLQLFQKAWREGPGIGAALDLAPQHHRLVGEQRYHRPAKIIVQVGIILVVGMAQERGDRRGVQEVGGRRRCGMVIVFLGKDSANGSAAADVPERDQPPVPRGHVVAHQLGLLHRQAGQADRVQGAGRDLAAQHNTHQLVA